MLEFNNPVIQSLQDVDIPVTVADPAAPDCPIIFCNTAFEDLTGHKFQNIVGQNCRFLQGPATDRAEVTRLKQAIETGEDCSVCLFNYQADGTPFHNFLIMRPFRSANGQKLLLGCQYHFSKFNGFEAFEMHNKRVQGVMVDRLEQPDTFQTARETSSQLRADTIRTRMEIYMRQQTDNGLMSLAS